MEKQHRHLLIERLFHEGLALPLDQRSSFLVSNCGGDPELLSELQALLSADDSAQSFLESPAIPQPSLAAPQPKPTTMAGCSFGHYEILELIGKGGMGEVYRARDMRLDRDVAIKFVPQNVASDETKLRRLEREARMLASLNHPNIATIHGLEYFDESRLLVMELVPGETLDQVIARGPMPVEQALSIFRQIAEALEAAHARGVIHRDLKPANVKVSPQGTVKLLDFGLAKTLDAASAVDANSPIQSLTDSGLILGTPAYMSPEQALGQSVDSRTDIWAFGALFYEALTAERAFGGRNLADVFANIIHRNPDWTKLPAGTPNSLSVIIHRCLEKDVAARPRTISDVIESIQTPSVSPAGDEWGDDKTSVSTLATVGGFQPLVVQRPNAETEVAGSLESVRPGPAALRVSFLEALSQRRWLALGIALAVLSLILLGLNAGGLRDRLKQPDIAPEIQSLAVLPLTNISGDPDQEHFADGMTDALITELSTITSLKVISRTSVIQYKGTPKALPEIARELKVDGIVEGSVSREGDLVRVSVQLFHAATERNLWSRGYTRELTGILGLHGEIARAIADRIRVPASSLPESGLRTTESQNVKPEAFDLYLRARSLMSRWDNLPRACELLLQATEKDPDFAAAHGARATCLIQSANVGFRPPKEVFPVAQQAALRARELDPDHPETIKALFSVNFSILRDYHGAEKLIRRQLGLNPGDATSLLFLSELLSLMGRHDEAIAAARSALELSPRSYDSNLELGRILYYARRYEEAIAQLNAAVEIDPNGSAAYSYLSASCDLLGRYDEALAHLKKNFILFGEAPEVVTLMVEAYARGDIRGRLLAQAHYFERLAKLNKPSYGDAAAAYALLGERDRAFKWLDRAYNEYDSIIFRIQDPAFDSLRNDPRWRDLLVRLHLDDTPLASQPYAPPVPSR